jgi:hypothetical protein
MMTPRELEDILGEITWTWLLIGTSIKACTFGFLARSIYATNQVDGVTPSPLARSLMWLFLTIGAFSSALTVILLIVVLNDLESIRYLAPFWARMAARIFAAVALAANVVTGAMVVRALRAETRRRTSEARSTAHRQMRATERIADQGDETARARETEAS